MSLQDNLQLAEIRLVRIRQERQEKFQHLQQLRRTATGVLQALDLGIVRSEVFQNVSEELMITIPKYWLAPAVVALVAWVNDQKEVADRALAEALRRDEKKTSLFMALVTRRYGRLDASRRWFEHYFTLLDPKNLETEFITLLEGITNGVFAYDVRMAFQNQLKHWLDECMEDASLTKETRDQWKESLWAIGTDREISLEELGEEEYQRRFEELFSDDKYDLLRKYCTNWDEINESISNHQYYEHIAETIKSWLEQNTSLEPKIESAVDNLLDQLVSQVVGEELELKREERKLELVIKYHGDWTKANQNWSAEEQHYQPARSLLEIIRMGATKVGFSAATQKYCLAISKDWIKEAHEDITGGIRYQVPEKAELEVPLIENSDFWAWSYSLNDGSEETECVQHFMQHFQRWSKSTIKANMKEKREYSRRIKYIVFLVLSGMIGIITGSWIVFFLSFGGLFLLRRWQVKRPMKKQNKQYRNQMVPVVKAAIADVVDWRRELKAKDRHAEDLPTLLKDLKADEMLTAQYEPNRLVMTERR
ncbi:hypothetical protein [Risungbinella massiliensis]|uniref:hypothetical protein n=1 Tax=Risungbinella massiliensis TaxID=1329796 RepID=UPI00069B42A4|nr:hypothetical protein [Risungbinella massiliensis]